MKETSGIPIVRPKASETLLARVQNALIIKLSFTSMMMEQ